MKKRLPILLVLLLSTQAMAEEATKSPALDKKKLFVGAGLANNSIDLGPFGDVDDTGFQFFAG